MIWVVAGEDEAGREAALYYINGFIATRYNDAVALSAQLQSDVDDSRTVSSQRHSVAFVAFAYRDYLSWFLALLLINTNDGRSLPVFK